MHLIKNLTHNVFAKAILALIWGKSQLITFQRLGLIWPHPQIM
jgi:hypothetical protein